MEGVWGRLPFVAVGGCDKPGWWPGTVHQPKLLPICVCVSQYKLRGNCIFILDDGTCDWFWNGETNSYVVHNMSAGRTYILTPSGSFKGGKAPAAWLFPYVTRIRVSDTIRIGYADTPFPEKHWYGDTARIFLKLIIRRHLSSIWWICITNSYVHLWENRSSRD